MSTPVDIIPEKIDILLNKLLLHKLTKEEAREFMELLKDELKQAQRQNKKEYEKVITGLIEVLKMYLADRVNLYESNIDVVNRLKFANV